MSKPMAEFASKTNNVGNVAMMILAAQLSSLRSAEMQKALDAFEKLKLEIAEHHAKGRGVELTVIGEVPNQIDIAAQWAKVGDASQIVYFKDMYISSTTEPVNPNQNLPTYSPNYGESKTVDSEDWTFEDELKNQLSGERPSKLGKPRENFHFEAGTLSLPAPVTIATPSVQGLRGMYYPAIVLSHIEGDSNNIQVYGMKRSLIVGPIGQGLRING